MDVPVKMTLSLLGIVALSGALGLAAQEPPPPLEALPGGLSDSWRVSLPFPAPRRYATRYLSARRILQLRVLPAAASDFDALKSYDSRYIERVVIHDNGGEVVVDFQLRNFPVGWGVFVQENPWRLVLDLWPLGEKPRPTLEEQWSPWQGSAAHGGTQREEGGEARQTEERGEKFESSRKLETPLESSFSEKKTSEEKKYTKEKTQSKKAIGKKEVIPKGFLAPDVLEFPDGWGRLTTPKPLSQAAWSKLKSAVERDPSAFEHQVLLTKSLAEGGREKEALQVEKSMAAHFEREFKTRKDTLTRGAENAWLAGDVEASADWYRTVRNLFPGSIEAAQASLRLQDIDIYQKLNIRSSQEKVLPSEVVGTYDRIAQDTKLPLVLRLAATVRILQGVMETRPQSARPYQQILTACVKGAGIPFDLLKNCAYDDLRYKIDQLDLITADIQVMKYKELSPIDTRLDGVVKLLQARVRAYLEETARSKSWQTWVDFERKARPSLLQFTLEDPQLVFLRAKAHEMTGHVDAAVRFYGVAFQRFPEGPQKWEAGALAAKLLVRSGQGIKADGTLKKLEEDGSQSPQGVGEAALAILRDLAMPPWRNARAQKILVTELSQGRAVEKSLSVLVSLAENQRNNPAVAPIYERILAWPSRTPEEGRQVEEILLHRADDLREQERLQKAGELYFAVANLPQGTRRAEAAYKAGIVFARAGVLDKAKQAWQLAASDANDKRYSALASERLERMR